MALLTCDHVSVGYEGQPVAEALTFAVNPGDYLCIVGENGSGKTTLMKTILGLLSPLSGTMTMAEGMRHHIGYLPQQSAVQQDFPASVREVVLSGCLSRGGGLFYTRAQKALADRNMARLGIAGISNHCYRELSGGQQQRVLLARALCAADKMLLLDEPAAGLDPQITREMYQLIGDLNRSGLTIIMITHDIAAAVKQASHILHVSRTPLYFGETKGYAQSPMWSMLFKGEQP
ncbi:MAG: ABC transporter ATP-binding protein [Clostridiales bacterium]|jgi:zinc transport system ATP-binding protein|nr:ABC transporter ATP-binding protein [Clostridiales bacterium]